MGKKRKEIPHLVPPSTLIDTHCHLDMDHYSNDIDEVITKAGDHGITTIVTIGIDLNSSRNAVSLAEKYSSVFATVGFHPHDAALVNKNSLDEIGHLVEKNRESIVAFGEIGLDYAKNYSPPEVQRAVFADQLALANTLRLPIVIHDRDAHDDILKLLKKNGGPEFGGIMHCFSGDIDYARTLIDMGFTISIPGIVTFKKAEVLQSVAKSIPLDSMILETDGPFLAPDPYRGKRNEPLFLLYTAECVAILRDMDINELADKTTENALKLFNISTY